jgi:hypothetical protein
MTGFPERVVDRSRSGRHLLDVFPCPDHVLLGEPIKYARKRWE